MTRFNFIFISSLILFFNTNLLCEESEKLKIGLLAPFSGEYENLGNSLLLSSQLALNEIGDKNIIIVPRDSGSDDKKKLNESIKDLINQDIKIIVGPIQSNYFNELEKYKNTIFISLSNKYPEIRSNVISIGISLESQLNILEKFIKKEKRKKTLILFPNNNYAEFVENKIKDLKIKNFKVFKYSPDPKILTGEIQNLTNYTQRKRNLELRKKMLEDKEDEQSKKELNYLEQLYTIGNVNFDSIIVIDFGSSLKSLLTSLVFSDVNENTVLFTTINQWFDESIFFENTINNLYYPSVDLKEFQKYNKVYTKTFNSQPNEITILSYDAIGLIYFIWKKNKKISSINDFLIKDKIKGKIGVFSFKDRKVSQELKIYRLKDKKFTLY